MDNLVDAPLKPEAEDKLAHVDAELQTLHDGAVSQYYRDLMGRGGGPGSFHHLVGQWLSEAGDAGPTLDWKALLALTVTDFETCSGRLKETLQRGEAVDYANNTWGKAAGIALRKFLSAPMDHYREVMAGCRDCIAADTTANPPGPLSIPQSI